MPVGQCQIGNKVVRCDRLADREGHAKDHEFSGTSMREHWQSGYEDTKRTLKHQKWLTMPRQGAGIIVHDVHREED